ncbi:MAG: putative sugar O-methyltransferase [Actinomycetota bacterium]|nr:putative sugar O-methyltransferase [Actinomycetota bacterium]
MSLDRETSDAIAGIKSRIETILLERSAIENPDSEPSAYWSEYCERLKYLMGLEEQHFSRLRDHTWQITGDIYNRYVPPQANGYRSQLESGFSSLWNELPTTMHLDEPERTFGLEFNDRIVNTDLLRYQRLVAVMYKEGLLGDAAPASTTVLEIGGGYGGLAHQVAHCLGDSLARYVIVDLPEVLLFSASYLSIHNGPDDVFLYDPANPNSTVDQLRNGPARFTLVPNFRLDLIDGFPIHLALNIASFQEMTSVQVDNYLSTIASNLDGALISFNRSTNAEANAELGDLRDLFDRYFRWQTVEMPLTPTISIRVRVNRAARALVRRLLGRPTRYSEYELVLARNS